MRTQLRIAKMKNYLKNNYKFLETEIKSKNPNLKEEDVLTRLLAGHVLANVSSLSENDILDHITDGADDRGIDALHYSKEKHKLFLIQTKWSGNGKGTAISERDAGEFINGVTELLNEELCDFGNTKIKNLEPEISSALGDIDCEVQMILASTTTRPISKGANNRLSRFKNNVEIDFTYMDISEIFDTMASAEVSPGVTFNLDLTDIGKYNEIVNAYYGCVDGLTLATLVQKNQPEIFAKNLRGALGKTPVNDDLIYTAKDSPERFWYYNNGITFIAERVQRTLADQATRERATFFLSNGSIVNGAQTSSSLAKILADGGSETLAKLKCLVRLIELPPDGEKFSLDVTRYNNSQNSIGVKDFVSLDPFQKELQREIRREFGIDYYIRSGTAPDDDIVGESIDLQEATVALVSVGKQVVNAVRAKDKISSLWRDIDTSPYTDIFDRDIVTATALVKSVEALRVVENFLIPLKKGDLSALSLSGARVKERKLTQIATHGNRLFAFYLLTGSNPFRSEESVDQFKDRFSKLSMPEHFMKFANAVSDEFPDCYLARLFKNRDKSAQIINALDPVW